MNGQPETEQLQNFHERLSHWVSRQGFWFQLRYSLSSGGAKGALAFHMFKIITRVALFAVVVAVGIWIFLLKQSGTRSYVADLSDTLEEKFAAEEIELRGFESRNGEFYISRMALRGGENTFFTGMEVKNLKCRVSIFDQFKSEWDPGLIQISRATLDLRAGADSEASAKAIGDVLFQDTGGVKLDSIAVADMSLHWGYSDRTKGFINGSKMRAQRIDDGWRLRFKGGTFTQNWLKRMPIEEMDVVIGRQGIVFEKALFKKGDGYLTFVGMKVKAGQRPEVSGTMKLRKISVSSIIPPTVRNFVEGSISGEFKVFGSTNSTDGIGYKGSIDLAGEDMVVVRDRVHLLRALSVVDAFNNYRRVDFRNGSLDMKSHGGRLEISNVDLKADDLLTLKGHLTVRQPTDEEALAFVDPGSDDAILEDDEIGDGPDISLQRAAKSASGGNRIGFQESGDDSLFNRLGLGLQNRRLEEKASEQLSRSYRYEGDFSITLPGEAFARAPHLVTLHPVSEKDGRIHLDVPIDGVLYDLTLGQADEIYKNGTRK